MFGDFFSSLSQGGEASVAWSVPGPAEIVAQMSVLRADGTFFKNSVYFQSLIIENARSLPVK